MPDDFKPPQAMLAKFTDTIKGKLADGKLSMTPQDVVDLYVGISRDANAAWQKQVEDVDKANEAACKARFSADELTAAETAVGWFSSFDPAFRDVAKRQLNDPAFTNAMRIVGELLQEDTIEPGARPPAPPADKRPLRERAATKLYGTKQ